MTISRFHFECIQCDNYIRRSNLNAGQETICLSCNTKQIVPRYSGESTNSFPPIFGENQREPLKSLENDYEKLNKLCTAGLDSLSPRDLSIGGSCYLYSLRLAV